MGVIDFNPSSDVGVLYLTEADLVGGYNYKGKLLKFSKVLLKIFFWDGVRCFLILPFSMLQILETKRNFCFSFSTLTYSLLRLTSSNFLLSCHRGLLQRAHGSSCVMVETYKIKSIIFFYILYL